MRRRFVRRRINFRRSFFFFPSTTLITDALRALYVREFLKTNWIPCRCPRLSQPFWSILSIQNMYGHKARWLLFRFVISKWKKKTEIRPRYYNRFEISHVFIISRWKLDKRARFVLPVPNVIRDREASCFHFWRKTDWEWECERVRGDRALSRLISRIENALGARQTFNLVEP